MFFCASFILLTNGGAPPDGAIEVLAPPPVTAPHAAYLQLSSQDPLDFEDLGKNFKVKS